MSGWRRAPRGAPRPVSRHCRYAITLAPARCLAARVHQPAAQVELALDPAQLPLWNSGVRLCRRRDQRPGVEDWSDHRSLACRYSRSIPSMCLSACMNSRASGARCHKRRIGIAGMPEARSGQRGGKTSDDGVSHRLVPVRQHVTKHLFPAHSTCRELTSCANVDRDCRMAGSPAFTSRSAGSWIRQNCRNTWCSRRLR